jgi:DNA-binding NarL/FixJ family response regulator
MFPSRIREALRPTAGTVVVVGTEEAALRAAADSPEAILINLSLRRADPYSIIGALKAAYPSLPVLAFAGHVEREKHDAARAAGADSVAANSSVSMHLLALLETLRVR